MFNHFTLNCHSMKSVQIRSFFLDRIFLYSDWIRIFTVNLRIQSEYRKIRTRKNSVFGQFWRSVLVPFRFFKTGTMTYDNPSGICQIVSLASETALKPLLVLENRGSRPEVFCEKGVLINFAEFKRKHLCQSLFLNKISGLMLSGLFYFWILSQTKCLTVAFIIDS